MRHQEVDGQLAYIQRELDRMGDESAMRSTQDGLSPLKMLAFSIGCCRAALETKECDSQQTNNTGSPKLPLPVHWHLFASGLGITPKQGQAIYDWWERQLRAVPYNVVRKGHGTIL